MHSARAEAQQLKEGSLLQFALRVRCFFSFGFEFGLHFTDASDACVCAVVGLLFNCKITCTTCFCIFAFARLPADVWELLLLRFDIFWRVVFECARSVFSFYFCISGSIRVAIRLNLHISTCMLKCLQFFQHVRIFSICAFLGGHAFDWDRFR